MAKIKKNKLTVLIGIRFDGSMNKFEEKYGFSTSYSKIEQLSYVELKEMINCSLEKGIKFRKHAREGMKLLIRAEMLKEDMDKVLEYNSEGVYKFFHNFKISEITLLNHENN